MMKEREVIKFNNKEYTVVASTLHKKKKYAFIINIENFNDVLFIKNTLNEVEIIEEKELLGELIPIFNKKLSEI
ncbi:MAG: hypothetical protein E7158_02780 [Firmicutes bacterium]|nr:hypothetical protein [Bacillota bacterium]